MAKLTEYPAATQFDSGDILIKDGTNGTKKITAENAAADLVSKAVDTTLSQAGKAADAAAVGAEIGNLKSDVNNLDVLVRPIISVTETSGYIAGNGSISTAGDTTAEVYTNYFEVTEGEVITFEVSNINRQLMWLTVGLLTENKSWISRNNIIDNQTTAKGEYTFTVPNGACYLAYTYRTYHGDVTVVAKRDEIKNILDDVDLTKKELGYVKYDSSYGQGYFNGSGGITNPSQASEIYTETYIPVVGGETLTATINLTETKNQWARWTFYDSNKNYLSYDTKESTNGRTISFQISVPNGASYMRISFRSYDILVSLVIERNKGAFEALSGYSNILFDKIIKYNKNCIFIAHQGYDPESVGTNSGNNKLEGYYAAAEHGFDAGETDIKFTLDQIPVCCHDDSFVDATSGVTVVIAETNLSDLQQHDFYGAIIPTFESVLKACKDSGIMLFIDQLSSATETQLRTVIDIVKQYAMQDNVYWIFAPHANANVQIVSNAFPTTGFEILSSNYTSAELITYANSVVTDDNKVYCAVNYSNVTADTVKELSLTLDSRAKMAVWTIPEWIPTCLNYMHYCGAITSNRTCYNDVYKYGIK